MATYENRKSVSPLDELNIFKGRHCKSARCLKVGCRLGQVIEKTCFLPIEGIFGP